MAIDSNFRISIIYIGASVCRLYQLTPEAFAAKWDALCIQHSLNVNQFTLNDLDKMKKEIHRQCEKRRIGNIENTVYNKNTLPKLDLLNGIRNHVRDCDV
jgi:phosphoglycerol transferase MdoB-like AlkP superfamily enzyme